MRTPPRGLPANEKSAWRMLRRTPMAVIHRQGPSIRQRVMLATGTRNSNLPKRAVTRPSPTVTHALSAVTPNTTRSSGADRRPMRMG